ncbi:hypothetical protein BDZ91DRAFT_380618 [Kalaharituber pfeilii]|nr:hypothetical protein BDZ91DRAFT_380618 [Kalaharituber pfeilii]
MYTPGESWDENGNRVQLRFGTKSEVDLDLLSQYRIAFLLRLTPNVEILSLNLVGGNVAALSTPYRAAALVGTVETPVLIEMLKCLYVYSAGESRDTFLGNLKSFSCGGVPYFQRINPNFILQLMLLTKLERIKINDMAVRDDNWDSVDLTTYTPGTSQVTSVHFGNTTAPIASGLMRTILSLPKRLERFSFKQNILRRRRRKLPNGHKCYFSPRIWREGLLAQAESLTSLELLMNIHDWPNAMDIHDSYPWACTALAPALRKATNLRYLAVSWWTLFGQWKDVEAISQHSEVIDLLKLENVLSPKLVLVELMCHGSHRGSWPHLRIVSLVSNAIEHKDRILPELDCIRLRVNVSLRRHGQEAQREMDRLSRACEAKQVMLKCRAQHSRRAARLLRYKGLRWKVGDLLSPWNEVCERKLRLFNMSSVHESSQNFPAIGW